MGSEKARAPERVEHTKKVSRTDEVCRVTGINDDLKGTQTYPTYSGVAVAKSYQESLAEINDDERGSCSDATEYLMGAMDESSDDWKDAEFSRVCAYLGMPFDQLCAQL